MKGLSCQTQEGIHVWQQQLGLSPGWVSMAFLSHQRQGGPEKGAVMESGLSLGQVCTAMVGRDEV